MKAHALLASLSPVRPFPTKEDAPQLLLPRMAADELPPHREQPWIIDKRGYRKVDPAMTVRSIIGAMLLAGIWRTVFEPIGADKLDVKALARHHADLMLYALRSEKVGTS